MSRLPDLVRDTRLNTSFKDNITIHHYDESDDENDARSTWRSECWQQTNHLGHGGCGDVWLQQCVSGKRGHERRAVKIIPRVRLKDKKDSYMAELEAIAKFSQRRYSKCFVKLLGWYDTDSSLYIAMEYFPLGDLEKYMSNNGPMHEADAQEVSFQLLEGLSYMHREGFAHRDVKPGNVLIRSTPPKSKWWVKISDFGISKRVEGSKAQSTVRGTIQYMAPELIWHEAGNPIDYMAADMWALGAMVYRMLTLMPVFSTPGAYNYYLVNVDSFPLEELRKRDASSDATLFIRSLMGPRPGERLASDKAMKHAWVASFQSHLTQISASPVLTPTIHSTSRQSASTSNQNPWATMSTSSAEFSIEARQPRVTAPASDKITKVSSHAPSAEFIGNRLPTVDNGPVSQRVIREYVDKPGPLAAISPEFSAKLFEPWIRSAPKRIARRYTVQVNNIAATTGDSEVKEFFRFCGKVTNIKITTEGETKSAKVTFEKETAATTALLLNDTQLGPNHITVVSAAYV